MPSHFPSKKGPPKKGPSEKSPPKKGLPKKRPVDKAPPKKAPSDKAPPRQGPPKKGPPRQGPPKRRLPSRGPRRVSRPTSPATPSQEGERLQKILASAGLGSRRECEELITTGRVEIDRKMVQELGTRVNPVTQEIRVDGLALRRSKPVYYAVNKPEGVVTTNRDPSGRPRVIDLLPMSEEHLFPIGRLDMSSEGLILVTNDGELANRLTHPRFGVSKTYRVQVAGRPDAEVLAKLRHGVHLAEGVARVEDIRVKSHQKQSSMLEIVLREGRNREIRRLLARVGHKVMRLTRIAVGPVRLGAMPPGAVRTLTRQEVESLYAESRVENS